MMEASRQKVPTRVGSAVLLLVFKLASNRRLVRRTRNQAVARILEFLLFRDDIVVNLGAFGRVMAANLAYLGSLLLPLLVSLPVSLGRFSYCLSPAVNSMTVLSSSSRVVAGGRFVAARTGSQARRARQ